MYWGDLVFGCNNVCYWLHVYKVVYTFTNNHSVVFSQHKMNAKKIALVVLHVIWLACWNYVDLFFGCNNVCYQLHKLKVVPFSASVVRLIMFVIDNKFTKLFHSQLVLLAVEDLWYVDGLSKKETVNTITFIFYTKTEP